MTTWAEAGREEKGAPTQKINLTQKVARELPLGKTRTQVYDLHCAGLGLRIEVNNRRSFFWCRKIRGRAVFKSIGTIDECPVTEARETCEEWNGKLSEWRRHGYEGDDPFETARGTMTFGETVDLYLAKRVEHHAAHPDQAKQNVEWMIAKYVGGWKPRKLSAIHEKDVRALHTEIGKHAPSQANRVVQCVRRVFNFAIKEEKIFPGPNPAVGVRFYPERKRKRFLDSDEMDRLLTALAAERHLDLKDFVLLSLFIGTRKAETLSMAWCDLSLRDSLWRVPAPKGGEEAAYSQPLIPEACALLRHRQKHAEGHKFVFHSERAEGHICDFRGPWYDLLERAKIEHFTIHDLRRSHGGWQAMQGASLPIIGAGLGHSANSSATAIYAPLNQGTVRQSKSNAVSAMLSNLPNKIQKKLFKSTLENKRAITLPKED